MTSESGMTNVLPGSITTTTDESHVRPISIQVTETPTASPTWGSTFAQKLQGRKRRKSIISDNGEVNKSPKLSKGRSHFFTFGHVVDGIKSLKGVLPHQDTDEFRITRNDQTPDWLPQVSKEVTDAKWILNPYAESRRFWDILILLVLFWTAVVVPYRLALMMDFGIDNAWFWIDRLIDCIFITDVILNFFTAVQHRGKWVISHKKIAKRYMRGWFVLDLVSSFPFDLVVQASIDSEHSQVGRTSKLLKIVRLTRLGKLVRFTRLSRILSRLENFIDTSYASVTIGKFVGFVFLCAHWISCIMLLMHHWGDHERSWLVRQTFYSNAYNATDDYMAALYFAFATMTTIGFGDVVPTTTTERSVGIIFMIIGALCFSYVIMTVVQLVGDMNRNRNDFKRLMDNLNEYFRYRHVPKNLRSEIRQYFKYRQNNRFFMEKELLNDMSRHLRWRLVFHVNRNVIQNVPFFKNIKNPVFISELMLRMKYTCAAPREIIVKEGTLGDNMFILSKGSVAVYSSKGKTVRRLQAGDFFGEISLLMSTRRTASVVADTWCDFLTLSRQDFDVIIAQFPKVKRVVIKHARERLRNTHKDVSSFTDAVRKDDNPGGQLSPINVDSTNLSGYDESDTESSPTTATKSTSKIDSAKNDSSDEEEHDWDSLIADVGSNPGLDDFSPSLDEDLSQQARKDNLRRASEKHSFGRDSLTARIQQQRAQAQHNNNNSNQNGGGDSRANWTKLKKQREDAMILGRLDRLEEHDSVQEMIGDGRPLTAQEENHVLRQAMQIMLVRQASPKKESAGSHASSS